MHGGLRPGPSWTLPTLWPRVSPPRRLRAHRDHIGDAAVEVALVVLDGDGPILLDPLHGQWAIQLQGGGGVGAWVHSPPPPLARNSAARTTSNSLTRNLRQNSSMELISAPWTCRKAALYWTRSREQAAVYLWTRPGCGPALPGPPGPPDARQPLAGWEESKQQGGVANTWPHRGWRWEHGRALPLPRDAAATPPHPQLAGSPGRPVPCAS